MLTVHAAQNYKSEPLYTLLSILYLF